MACRGKGKGAWGVGVGVKDIWVDIIRWRGRRGYNWNPKEMGEGHGFGNELRIMEMVAIWAAFLI